jgi:Family of unknown function (DUF6134)
VTHLSRIVQAAYLACFFGVASLGATAAAAPVVLSYEVDHSLYGNVGTYINSIERNGDTVTVRTEARFKASLLGIVYYREDADRIERWQGKRIVYFSGVTMTNGHAIKLQGEARDNQFIIDSPTGRIIAPSTVVPANPWSDNFLGSDTMMLLDTGEIERVRVSAARATSVSVRGAVIPAREFQIDGKSHYKIWLDAHNVPVKFSVDESSGEVTFTLVNYH